MPIKNLLTLGVGVSPGSVAPLILLGLSTNPGAPSTETLMDVAHKWQLKVDGTDRWANLQGGALEWTENDSGEIGTLRATLVEYGTALGIVEWQEIVLLDASTPVWGGYITQATPIADGLGTVDRLRWEITAESYETILNRSARVRYVYNGWNPGDILADLFNRALDSAGDPPAQTVFDTSTYVTTGTWPDAAIFAVDGGKLTDTIDTLAQRCGYIWWIDASKAVHFGPASDATAPFGIKLAGSADYSAYFPPDKNTINGKIDASDIRNVITVIGGMRVSAVTSDTFTGDGSTLLFALSHHPIVEIVSIGIGGVVQTFGTDWYHSFDDYDCLVNYSHGTVRWDTGNAPPNLDTISIAYRWGEQTTVTVTDAASVSYYGRSFYYELRDSSLASAAAATAAGNAMLADYAYGLINGSFTVKRSGIKAGQRIEISYSALSLSGYYQVRRVVGQIRKGGLVSLDVQFGGKVRRLTLALGTNTGGGSLLGGGLSGSGEITNTGGGAVREDRGQRFTVFDYGSIEADTLTSAVPSKMFSFVNDADETLHRLEAWTDTAASQTRQVMLLGSNPNANERGYLLLQSLAQKEAWARLRAVGGYGLGGQQDASVHVYAYRKEGTWNHSRVYLEADTTRLKAWSGTAAPSPGSDTLPDGLLVYADGTWDPIGFGSGLTEGLYLYTNSNWVKLGGPLDTPYRWGDATNWVQVDGDGVMTFGGVGRIAPRYATTTVTGTATISTATYSRCNSDFGAFTITLPTAVGITGRWYVIKKVDSSANVVTLDGDGTETIDGATTYALATQWKSVTVISNGSNWEIIAST